MNQIRAVRKMILQVQRDGFIPPEHYRYLWKCFKQMYVAGFDSNTARENNGRQHPIQQLDRNKKVIEDFPGISTAARLLNYSERMIGTAIRRGNLTRNGHYWIYKDQSTEKKTHKNSMEKSE
jgi:hypothetical protein